MSKYNCNPNFFAISLYDFWKQDIFEDNPDERKKLLEHILKLDLADDTERIFYIQVQKYAWELEDLYGGYDKDNMKMKTSFFDKCYDELEDLMEKPIYVYDSEEEQKRKDFFDAAEKDYKKKKLN